MKVNTYAVVDKLFSVRKLIKQIRKEWIIRWWYKKIEDYLKNNVIMFIRFFIKNKFKPDWYKICNLKWNVYELRIMLNEKKLLRIIFYYDGIDIILLTWYIIKNNLEKYDKKTKEKIEKNYCIQIERAKNLYWGLNKSWACNYINLSKIINK